MSLSGLLKQSELLSVLPEEMIEKVIIPNGQVRNLPQGRILYFPNEEVFDFTFVLMGRLKVQHQLSEDKINIVSTLDSGDVYGLDIAGNKNKRAPFTLVADQPTQVFVLPMAFLLDEENELIPWREAILRRLLALLSTVAMRKEHYLAVLTRTSIRERVMVYLMLQVERQHSYTVRIPFTQEELAAFLCVNRSRLSRELNRMRAEGLIDYEKKTFTILKKPEL